MSRQNGSASMDWKAHGTFYQNYSRKKLNFFDSAKINGNFSPKKSCFRLVAQDQGKEWNGKNKGRAISNPASSFDRY
jgi:hypothetical protein